MRLNDYSMRLNPGKFSVLYLLGVFILTPASTFAAWNVTTQSGQEGDEQITFAYSTNESGYTFEIYRDSIDSIRARFNLAGSILQLAEKSCPTYQVDRGFPQNRSVYDAPCISSDQWAEYILGHVVNRQISSTLLLALMNGMNISFRFILENGDYRETSFSLQGSRNAITQAIGQENNVLASE